MTRDEVMERAGARLAAAAVRAASLTPREAAEAAVVPGGPTVAELEARIRAERGQVAA